MILVLLLALTLGRPASSDRGPSVSDTTLASGRRIAQLAKIVSIDLRVFQSLPAIVVRRFEWIAHYLTKDVSWQIS